MNRSSKKMAPERNLHTLSFNKVLNPQYSHNLFDKDRFKSDYMNRFSPNKDTVK